MRLYRSLLIGAGVSANAGVLAFLLERPLASAFFIGAFVVCMLIVQSVDVSQAA